MVQNRLNLDIFVIFAILFASFSYTPTTRGLSLDEFGYYKIIVAVDERTVQNSVANYTDNIKMGIQDLSDLLHHATNGKFSISEAHILVPDHWLDVQIDGVATTQFYDGADFKISHIFSLPHVDNPNTCGYPGRDMQIPYDFFDHGDAGSYGRLGKALLAQFARLRFGVWEEHGYPGEKLFPYYHKKLAGNNWEVNACTDAPVEGIYKNINDGSPCGPDPGDNSYPPPSDCRFYPNIPQTAKSSLMSYHYLPTFESFCNSTNHDISLPTPQNYYCQYKSVMEVIQESPDWKKVTRDNTAGRVNIKVVKMPKTPLLYILLDAGLTQVPGSILSQISSRLSTFIATPALRNVVAGVGQFPAKNGGGDPYTELIPWLPVRNNTADFVAAFETAFGNEGGLKNYAGALKDVLMRLNKRKHEEGAAILVIKTGPESDTGALTAESEVMIPLLMGNAKIFAIEVHANPMQSVNALERIVASSEGLHLSVKGATDLGQPFDDFLTQLSSTLQNKITPTKQYVLGMDSMANNREAVIVASNSKITQFLVFVMPLAGDLSSSVQLLRGDDGNYDDIVDFMELTWDSYTSVPASRRNFYYSSNDSSNAPLDSLHWQTLNACSNLCKTRIVILLQVEDISLIPRDIELKVTTSAIDNVVDFTVANAGTHIGAAFAIYAKLEQDGIPIQSTPGLTVTAIISNPGLPVPEAWSLELKDNGNASPDAMINDGIFSGAFVPEIYSLPEDFNGLYKIFVTVKYVAPDIVITTTTDTSPTDYISTTDDGEAKVNENYDDDDDDDYENYENEEAPYWTPSVGKLFPINNHRQIGCGNGYLGCSNKIPEQDFILSSDLESDVQFINFASLLFAVPTRIMDLVVTSMGNYTVNLRWTAPVVLYPQMNPQEQPGDLYQIRHRDTFEGLLYDFDKSENIPTKDNPTSLPVGFRHNITYSFGFPAARFYGIRTITTGNNVIVPSQISVIAGVDIREELITTTTTTTTTRRPTTVTTLPPKTTPPGPSTTEEGEITTIVTTPRTTLPRSTTTRAPPTTTPTVRSTTTFTPPSTEDPIKHWYKTKEGIITLSVAGVALFLLVVSGGGLYIYLTKFR